MESAAVAAAQAAAAVYAAARSHKRAADTHRKQARNLMAEFDRLCRVCKQNGIDIQIEAQTPKEGHSPWNC